MQSKVYYADTDAGGVVYYASYLRWLEAARCELLAELGTSVAEFAAQGVVFPVARLEVDYLVPAVLGDTLHIVTQVARVRHVRFIVNQQIHRPTDHTQILKATVTVACIQPDGKLRTLPTELAAGLRGLLEADSA